MQHSSNPATLLSPDQGAMAIRTESVDLVIDGADFYGSIQKAIRLKLKNGWCDFRRLADQQARRTVGKTSVVGSIWYFDPRVGSLREDSYGALQRRRLWFGRLKYLNVSEFLVSPRLTQRSPECDPGDFRKATDEVLTALARQNLSPYVLVLASSKESPLISHLKQRRDTLTELILTPDEAESGRLTHSDLEEVRLYGLENENLWRDYEILKQDSDQLAALWQTRVPEKHQLVQKLLRRYQPRKGPDWLNSLGVNPASDEEFLLHVEAVAKPFLDAIRHDNRRLADNCDCVKFIRQRLVREVADKEIAQRQPPPASAPVTRWVVRFHHRFQLEFQRWPPDAQHELREGCARLQGLGFQLEEPLVKKLAVDGYPGMKELRIHAADRAWRIAFVLDDNQDYILLAGGSKSGQSEDGFYYNLKKQATARFREHAATRAGSAIGVP